MNGQFDLHIMTQPYSEVYCGYISGFTSITIIAVESGIQLVPL